MSKNLAKFSRTLGGAAAAMLSAGAIAHAQTPVGVGAVRRDSVATTRVVVLQGRMDSITVLMHRIANERYGSPAWMDLTGQLDTLVGSLIRTKLSMSRGVAERPVAFREAQSATGYLGINAQGPTLVITDSAGTRYRFLAYQPIISVDLGSPADRAGIEPGDVLVGYNGVDLIGHEFNLGQMLVPKKRVDVTVRHGGDIKEYALTVASTPDEVSRRRTEFNALVRFPTAIVVGEDGEPRFATPPQPTVGTIRASTAPVGRNVGDRAPVASGGFGRGRGVAFGATPLMFINPNGLFGAGLSNVGEDLAKVLQLPRGVRRAVLVNEVPEDTPAYRAGLRSADVIVAANGDSVGTVGQLRNLLMMRADHSAELEVVRDRKVRKLTITWPE